MLLRLVSVNLKTKVMYWQVSFMLQARILFKQLGICSVTVFKFAVAFLLRMCSKCDFVRNILYPYL
jgi:hypothetical protein